MTVVGKAASGDGKLTMEGIIQNQITHFGRALWSAHAAYLQILRKMVDDTFSGLVKSGKVDEFWFRVANLTQTVIQAILQSMDTHQEVLIQDIIESKTN